jgi:prepilin-type N-terminal cleavage/methylation domain-containing protein
MRTSENSQRGFTLVELMVVVALGLIIMGMAIGGIPSMLKTARADAGLTELAAALRFSRESSISNRRNVQLTFGGNTITATRVEYCPATCTTGTVGSFPGCVVASGACGAKTTALRTVTLEGYAQFLLVSGLPDTPDAFGKATATAFGSYTPPMFTTDGSFINSQGDVLNGSVFIAIPGDRTSARAITIFGPTGAMHLWRWNGTAWVEV